MLMRIYIWSQTNFQTIYTSSFQSLSQKNHQNVINYSSDIIKISRNIFDAFITIPFSHTINFNVINVVIDTEHIVTLYIRCSYY